MKRYIKSNFDEDRIVVETGLTDPQANLEENQEYRIHELTN